MEIFYLQAARVLLYLLVATITVLQFIIDRNFINWDLMRVFYLGTSVGIIIHGLVLAYRSYIFSRAKLLFITFILDLALISWMLSTTELNQSLFFFMYLVTILIAGLAFGRQGSTWVAIGASISFSLATLLGPESSSMSFLFILVLNNVSFFVIAALSGHISDKLGLVSGELEISQNNLSKLTEMNNLVVQAIPIGLATLSAEGEFLSANPELEKILKRNDLVGLNMYELFAETVAKSTPFKIEVTRGEQINPQILSLEWIEKVDDKNQTYQVLMIQDMTEVRKMQSSLRQSEKLAAIGKLSAGIAHEIRNPLAGISGSVELLSQNQNTEDDKKLFKIILKEIARLNNLITDFLDFAKPEKIPTERVKLDSVIEECINHVAIGSPNLIIKDIRTQAEIFGEFEKLKQVFLNFLINAKQATEKVEHPEVLVMLTENGSNYQLSIKDNGSGISPEAKERLFEPFFTTKPKGTGLGLAISYKILQNHRANVEVRSESGLGTEFVISFPKTI